MPRFPFSTNLLRSTSAPAANWTVGAAGGSPTLDFTTPTMARSIVVAGTISILNNLGVIRYLPGGGAQEAHLAYRDRDQLLDVDVVDERPIPRVPTGRQDRRLRTLLALGGADLPWRKRFEPDVFGNHSQSVFAD